MEDILYELKPKITKAFMFSLAKIVFVASIFLGGFYYIRYLGVFEVFIELLNEAGLELTETFFNISFPFAVVFVTFTAVGLNYISLNKVRYVCYTDHISLYRNFMIFQVHETNIPYWNIKSIVLDPNQKSSIKIEAAGLKRDIVKLEYIGSPKEALEKIQQIIRNFKANYYADYIKQQRIKSISEQY